MNCNLWLFVETRFVTLRQFVTKEVECYTNIYESDNWQFGYTAALLATFPYCEAIFIVASSEDALIIDKLVDSRNTALSLRADLSLRKLNSISIYHINVYNY